MGRVPEEASMKKELVSRSSPLTMVPTCDGRANRRSIYDGHCDVNADVGGWDLYPEQYCGGPKEPLHLGFARSDTGIEYRYLLR